MLYYIDATIGCFFKGDKQMKVSNSRDRIRELMAHFGLNQTELCKRTGIQKSALSNYLNGDREPRQDQISLIVDPFGVNPAWLMGYDVPMEMQPHDSVEIHIDADNVDEESLSLIFDDEKQVKEFMNFYKVFRSANQTKRDAVLSLLESPQSDS